MLAVPTKPAAGVKVTWPVAVLSDQVPWVVVRVACWPAVVGSRSVVPVTSVVPLLAVSLVAGVSTAGVVPIVVVLSLLAVGAAGALTVTDRLAWFEVWPKLSWMV